MFDYIFIVLTETWLNNCIFNNGSGMDSYNLFRCDRYIVTNMVYMGGGVLVVIQKDVSSSVIPVTIPNVKQLFVQFFYNGTTFILCCVYFPLNTPLVSYELFSAGVERLSVIYKNDVFVIYGDFNPPEVTWTNDKHSMDLSIPLPLVVEFNVFLKSLLSLIFSA